jgi:hypothetical protein
VSPIGLVPKKTPGGIQDDPSFIIPSGKSINDFIDPSLCSVQYTSFDEAVKMIQELGQHCKLFKSDIKSAYRLIPISPNYFKLLGFCFDNKYYFDKALPQLYYF